MLAIPGCCVAVVAGRWEEGGRDGSKRDTSGPHLHTGLLGNDRGKGRVR